MAASAHLPVGVQPDGQLLAATVRRRPALLDANSGHVVALVKAPRLGISGWAWEDDEHLLGVAHRGEWVAMVRIDLRGNVTRVGPIVNAVGWRYVFETRP